MSLVRLCMRCFVMERASPAFCPYSAYIWQIRRPDRRHLTYIWQTHAAKTSKTYPRSGCFRRRRAIYKRDVSGQEAKSAIHNADAAKLEWEYYAKRFRAITRCGLQQRDGAWLGSRSAYLQLNGECLEWFLDGLSFDERQSLLCRIDGHVVWALSNGG